MVNCDKKIKSIREETKNEARELNTQIEQKNAEVEKIKEIIRDREYQIKESNIQKRLLTDDHDSL